MRCKYKVKEKKEVHQRVKPVWKGRAKQKTVWYLILMGLFASRLLCNNDIIAYSGKNMMFLRKKNDMDSSNTTLGCLW